MADRVIDGVPVAIKDAAIALFGTADKLALAVGIVVLLIVAVFDIGRAVFTYTSITNAAREGARAAARGEPAAGVQAAARQVAPGRAGTEGCDGADGA